MSHIETLVLNEVRKALENLQRSGVGYINEETYGNIFYVVDDKTIRIVVDEVENNSK